MLSRNQSTAICLRLFAMIQTCTSLFKYVLSTMGVSKESISKFFENNITFAWSTKFFENNIYFRFGKQYLLSLRKTILLSLRKTILLSLRKTILLSLLKTILLSLLKTILLSLLKTILLSLLKTILLSLGQKKSSHMPNVFFYLKAFLVKSW